MSSLFTKLEDLGIRSDVASSKRTPLKGADLKRVEDLFGFPIPDSYWEFQKRYGASGFDNAVDYEVPADWDRRNNGAPNQVWQFYGINPQQEHQVWNLVYHLHSSQREQPPPHFLPICESDGLSTVVYLSGRSQDYGHVFALTRWQIWEVWNGELSTEEATAEAYHIADSFEDFVSKLHVFSEDS